MTLDTCHRIVPLSVFLVLMSAVDYKFFQEISIATLSAFYFWYLEVLFSGSETTFLLNNYDYSCQELMQVLVL